MEVLHKIISQPSILITVQICYHHLWHTVAFPADPSNSKGFLPFDSCIHVKDRKPKISEAAFI